MVRLLIAIMLVVVYMVSAGPGATSSTMQQEDRQQESHDLPPTMPRSDEENRIIDDGESHAKPKMHIFDVIKLVMGEIAPDEEGVESWQEEDESDEEDLEEQEQREEEEKRRQEHEKLLSEPEKKRLADRKRRFEQMLEHLPDEHKAMLDTPPYSKLLRELWDLDQQQTEAETHEQKQVINGKLRRLIIKIACHMAPPTFEMFLDLVLFMFGPDDVINDYFLYAQNPPKDLVFKGSTLSSTGDHNVSAH